MPPCEPALPRRRLALAVLPLAAPALLAAAPPAEGDMLVTPLTGQASGDTLRWLHRDGIAVLAEGPLPGSWLVRGTRTHLFPLAIGHGAMVTAARPGGCLQEYNR